MSRLHDIERHAYTSDRLSIFREVIGITDVTPVACGDKRYVAKNIGLYKRVIDGERFAKIQYHAVTLLINAGLLPQVIFASILTVLGGSGASHVAITIFAALNTLLAGLLPLANGRGLPERFRQHQYALRRVREHIEQRERDFSRPDCALDLQEEIKSVIAMYNAVRANIENNGPIDYQVPLASTGTSKDFLISDGENAKAEKLREHEQAQSEKVEASNSKETERQPAATRDNRHDQEVLRQVAERMVSGNW